MTNLNIASNLKKLRKQREITQEDLANFIGVSFQAVSKWERGEGYPDITILPALANFFEITVDELIGMNEIKNAERLNEIKVQQYKLRCAGKYEENITLLREALTSFPNDYYLLSELVISLCNYGDSEEEKKKNREESIKISERILAFCTDAEIRGSTLTFMCHSLHMAGEKERAIDLAQQLPTLIRSRECVLHPYLDRAEQIKECQQAVKMMVVAISNQIALLSLETLYDIDKTDHYSMEQAIKLCQKTIDFFRLLYEDGDFGIEHQLILWRYLEIAAFCIRLNKTEEAVDNIEKAAYHAIADEKMPETMALTSLLVNVLKFDKATMGSSLNLPRYLLERLEKEDIYSAILDDERVRNVITELGEYAK